MKCAKFPASLEERIGYSAKVDTFMEDGSRVTTFGVYSGTYKQTGKSMSASFAHLYEVRDGKIASMVQYVDSHIVIQALSET